jgi:AcrR family transcriptional regulator
MERVNSSTKTELEARPRRRSGEIIDAIAAVFAELGYHGASTRELANRLGMQQGSLYYYLPSKEAALEEVCLRGAGDFVERALEIVNRPTHPTEKLTALIRRHLEPTETRPAYVRCFLRERRFLPKASRRRIGRVARRYERILQSVIEAGVVAGEMRSDVNPRLATLAILGMCNASVDWIGKEPDAAIDSIAATFGQIATAGLARPRRGGGSSS